MFLGVLSQLTVLPYINDTEFHPVPGHGPYPLFWGLPFFRENATIFLVCRHAGLDLDRLGAYGVMRLLVGFRDLYAFTIFGQATSTNLPLGGLTVIASDLIITPPNGRYQFLGRIQLLVHVRLSQHGYKFVTIDQVILNDEVM